MRELFLGMVKNEESEEIIRLSENIIKYSESNNINLPDAVYYYLEEGPGSSHEWWNASKRRKIEIIEKLNDQFEIPDYYVSEKVKESREALKDTGIKIKQKPHRKSKFDIPDIEISSYTEEHMYYDMLFETVRWIIDDILQGSYTDLFDPKDYFNE